MTATRPLWYVLCGLIVLLLLPMVVSSSSCVIPVQMEGVEEGACVPVARVKVGHTDTVLRLALDFYSVGVSVSSHVPWERSTTYMMAAGIDVVDLCHHRIRLPVRYDPEAGFRAGCPTCDGTFGLGRFNPLWMVWKRVTLSGGAMILDNGNGHKDHTPIDSKGSEPISCVLGHQGFCLIPEVKIGNRSYALDFAFQTQETYLPPEVYDEYVGARSLESDPPDAWKNLEIWINQTKIVIQRHHIIPIIHTGCRKLLVRPNTRPGTEKTIVLGKSAWRALRILRDTSDNTIRVMNWNCNRNRTSWGWFLLILAGIFLLRWKTTQDALWSPRQQSEGVGLYPDRIMIEIFTSLIGMAAFFLPSVQSSLEGFRFFSIYSIVVISSLIGWTIFSMIIYYADRTEWIGDVFLVPRTSAPPPPPPQAPRFALHGARRRRSPSPPPAEGTVLIRLSPRVAIMRSLAVESILLWSTILLLNEIREDTLASLFPFLFMIGYLYTLLYWGWMALYYTPNITPLGIWMAWWAYYLVFLVASLWVTAVEITIPFFEREVPELEWSSEISAVMIYIFLAYFSTRTAGPSINQERSRLYYLGFRYIGPFRILRPTPDSLDRRIKTIVAYPRRRRPAAVPILSKTPSLPPAAYYYHQLGPQVTKTSQTQQRRQQQRPEDIKNMRQRHAVQSRNN